MKHLKNNFIALLSIFLFGCLLFTGCGSTTLIKSIPEGAKVFIDGEPVGVTPYQHYDTKIIGSHTDIRLIMDGYENLDTWITRDEDLDVGALVGGILFPPIPFLWMMKYKPQHTYEMIPYYVDPQRVEGAEENVIPQNNQQKSLSDKLYELKDLLDKGIITQQEFDAQKKKILAE
jgi:hypothetical protein